MKRRDFLTHGAAVSAAVLAPRALRSQRTPVSAMIAAVDASPAHAIAARDAATFLARFPGLRVALETRCAWTYDPVGEAPNLETFTRAAGAAAVYLSHTLPSDDRVAVAITWSDDLPPGVLGLALAAPGAPGTPGAPLVLGNGRSEDDAADVRVMLVGWALLRLYGVPHGGAVIWRDRADPAQAPEPTRRAEAFAAAVLAACPEAQP